MGMQIIFFLGCKLNTVGVLNFHYVELQFTLFKWSAKKEKNNEKK